MKLIDHVPYEFSQVFNDTKAYEFRDVEVIKEHTLSGSDSNWVSWPGREKNVFNWWELENGYAVGWNENPSIGWSFPVIKLKK